MYISNSLVRSASLSTKFLVTLSLILLNTCWVSLVYLNIRSFLVRSMRDLQILL